MADLFIDDDGVSPLGQGDIVWVAQAKLVAEQELPAGAVTGAEPVVGGPAGAKSLLWTGGRPDEEVWVHGLNTIGIVLAPDCAIDKDLHRVAQHLVEAEDLDEDAAYERAQVEAELLVHVAEIRTVADLPPHQRASVGHVGLMRLETFPTAPPDVGPFVVDFSRVTTVSSRIIERRLAIATAAMKHRLQAEICKHFAARNVELTIALTELFTSPVRQVDSLVAPEPRKGKLTMRVRVRFDDGRSAVLEARLTPEDLSSGPVTSLVQRKRGQGDDDRAPAMQASGSNEEVRPHDTDPHESGRPHG